MSHVGRFQVAAQQQKSNPAGAGGGISDDENRRKIRSNLGIIIQGIRNSIRGIKLPESITTPSVDKKIRPTLVIPSDTKKKRKEFEELRGQISNPELQNLIRIPSGEIIEAGFGIFGTRGEDPEIQAQRNQITNSILRRKRDAAEQFLNENREDPELADIISQFDIDPQVGLEMLAVKSINDSESTLVGAVESFDRLRETLGIAALQIAKGVAEVLLPEKAEGFIERGQKAILEARARRQKRLTPFQKRSAERIGIAGEFVEFGAGFLLLRGIKVGGLKKTITELEARLAKDKADTFASARLPEARKELAQLQGGFVESVLPEVGPSIQASTVQNVRRELATADPNLERFFRNLGFDAVTEVALFGLLKGGARAFAKGPVRPELVKAFESLNEKFGPERIKEIFDGIEIDPRPRFGAGPLPPFRRDPKKELEDLVKGEGPKVEIDPITGRITPITENIPGRGFGIIREAGKFDTLEEFTTNFQKTKDDFISKKVQENLAFQKKFQQRTSAARKKALDIARLEWEAVTKERFGFKIDFLDEGRVLPEAFQESQKRKTVQKTEQVTIPKELEPLAVEARKFDTAEEFIRDDFQQRVIAAQDFRDVLKVNGRRVIVNSDGTITLFHGTSKKNAEAILNSGRFNEGSFFSIRKGGIKDGDSPIDVAKRKFGKEGTVIEIKVDARDIEDAASGVEVFSPNVLKRGDDGVFASETRPTSGGQLTDFFNQVKQAEVPKPKIPQELRRLREINPELFRKAQKSATVDEFVKSVFKGKKIPDDTKNLTNFFNRLRDAGVTKSDVPVPTRGERVLPKGVKKGLERAAAVLKKQSIKVAAKQSKKLIDETAGRNVPLKEIEDRIEGMIADGKIKKAEQFVGLQQKFALKKIVKDNKTHVDKLMGKTDAEILPTKIHKTEKPVSELQEPPKKPVESTKLNQRGVADAISFEADKISFSKRLSSIADRAYTQVKDEFHPLARILGHSSLAMKKVRNFAGAGRRADEFLYGEGSFDFETFAKNGESFRNIVRTLGIKKINTPTGILRFKKEIKIKERDFKIYLVARRELDLQTNKTDYKTDISPEDVRATIKNLEKKYPDMKELGDRMRDYNDRLLQYAVDSGIISKEKVAAFKKEGKDYTTPFFRDVDDNKEFLGGLSAKFRSPIKKIKGSLKSVVDPYVNITQNTYKVMEAANKNEVLRDIIEGLIKLPDANKFIRITKPNFVPAGKVKVPAPPEAQAASFEQTVFVQSQFLPKNTVEVMIDGKPKYFEIDKDAYDAFIGLDRMSTNILTQILAFPASSLRAGAVLTPEFIGSNPVRDQFTAAVFSKYGYVPIYDLARGIYDLASPRASKVELRRLYRISGADFNSLASLDRETVERSVKEIVGGRGPTFYLRHPLEMLRVASEYMETATRMSEFRKALKDTGVTKEDIAVAGFDARDLTLNFARRGSTGKVLNRVIAFFNAQLEGIDKLVREHAKHPGRTSFKAASYITLPTILLYMVNRKDPNYKELPQWRKDIFWHIPREGGGFFAIPKPFELGLIYGTIPERLLTFIDTKDPESLDGLWDTIARATLPSAVPTAVIPPIENFANRSTFLDRPIVPRNREDLVPSLQFSQYTTETVKFLAAPLGMSPAKLENWIRGYTGGLGKYALQISDITLKAIGVAEDIPKPVTTIEDMPLLKRFLVKKPTGSRTESTNRLWDLSNEANMFLRSFKTLLKENPDKAEAFLEENKEQIRYAEAAKKATAAMGTIFNQRNHILESKDLTSEEKTEKLDEIDGKVAAFAIDFLGKIKKDKALVKETKRQITVGAPTAKAKEGPTKLKEAFRNLSKERQLEEIKKQKAKGKTDDEIRALFN